MLPDNFTDDDGDGFVILSRDEVTLNGSLVLRTFCQAVSGGAFKAGKIWVIFSSSDMTWQENEHGDRFVWDYIKQEWADLEGHLPTDTIH